MPEDLPGSMSSFYPHGPLEISAEDMRIVKDTLAARGRRIELVKEDMQQFERGKRIFAWGGFDYKDQSALIHDDGLRIGLGTDCDGLKALRNQINDQINDEQEAHVKYNKLGDELEKIFFENMATALYSAAADELSHAAILDIIVEVITEKCGA